MKKTIFLLMVFCCHAVIWSQQRIWHDADEATLISMPKVTRNSHPQNYRIYKLDLEIFKNQLVGAPLRGMSSGRSSHEIILPNADGKLEKYHVTETPIMESELAERYPMIKSYAAQGVNDPTAVARFSVTQFGLHSMTMSAGKSTVFIDPFTEDRAYYIVYKKSDLVGSSASFECMTEEPESVPSEASHRAALNTDDNTLRTYRLALSCTAEYGNIFAGAGTLAQQKANIQAQMAITMTRVNGIYEIDLGITMIFVSNNDGVIYLGNTNADPWTNEWNTRTAQTLDSIVGVNNYDIGHNFNTTGGGNAGCIACVCRAVSQNGTHKGRGYTGSANPTGDPFDVDYVAHEMGHQFGGYHTQSNANCRSGSGQTEVEPGSASTIMGYAGICAANVQNQSDAYFAYVNIRDIMAYVKTATGSCSVNTPIANQAPVVDAGLDYTIPRSTPFILTAEGSDPDGDILTYTWEQRDPQNPGSNAAPAANRAVGPMFRSIWGTTSPSRYMPNLATVLAGNTANTWEVVPSVARTMTFSVVARDNVAGGGQTASDLMTVSVSGTAGPFVVTVPNTNVNWTAGSNRTVTWNVAGTTANGVNCEFVDIYLSNNGGADFSTMLAAKVPNDGSEIVTMPTATGTQHRVMVRGHKNIFYDVSNTNFTVSAVAATFSLSFDRQHDGQNKVICQGESVIYNLLYETIGGFSGTTTFSATGNPVGTSISFSPNTINTSGTVQMTLSNTDSVAPGIYNIAVTGTSGATTKQVNLYVIVRSSAFSDVEAVSPADMEYGVSTFSTNIEWVADPSASSYDFELATDAEFNNIVVSTNLTNNYYTATNLTENINYFWRVLPKNESCSGIISDVFRFTTGQRICNTFNAMGLPVNIPTNTGVIINSVINIPFAQNQVIEKISVTLNVTHSYVWDLRATLISPSGTQFQLFAQQCHYGVNIDATFADDGVPLVCSGGVPAITGTFIPAQSLSTLIGQNSQGNWTLRIEDLYIPDGGAFNSWSLNVCGTDKSPLSCGTLTTVWNGSVWSNGIPVNNVAAIFANDFVTNGNIEACSVAVTGNADVVISSGDNMIVVNEVTVAPTASFTIRNNASLIQINDFAVNSGNVRMERMTDIRKLDYVFWSSPVEDFPVLNISPDTPQSYVWKWIPAIGGNFGNWINTNENMLNGKGYIVRGPNTFNNNTPQTFMTAFTGVPNNGIINPEIQRGSYVGSGYPSPSNPLITVTYNDDNWNLIGNPYPSAINALDFLTQNVQIEGAVRLWTHGNLPAGFYSDPFYGDFVYNYSANDYIIHNGTGTISGPGGFNGYIAAGQGFFILMNDGSATTDQVVFSNSMRNRAFLNNQFFRTAQTESSVQEESFKIWLDFIRVNGEVTRTLVGYVEGATTEKDRLFDAYLKSDAEQNFYSLIGEKRMSIQGRPQPLDIHDVVPLGFHAVVSGTHKIGIAHLQGLMPGVNIFLEDLELGILHNIQELPYDFYTESGRFDNRFQLRYMNETMGVNNLNLQQDLIITTGDSKLIIHSLNESIRHITVFDVLGRKLFEQKNISSQSYSPVLLPLNQTLLIRTELQNGNVIYRKTIF